MDENITLDKQIKVNSVTLQGLVYILSWGLHGLKEQDLSTLFDIRLVNHCKSNNYLLVYAAVWSPTQYNLTSTKFL